MKGIKPMSEETVIEAQPEQTYTPYTPEQIAAMPGAPVSDSNVASLNSEVITPTATENVSNTPSEASQTHVVYTPIEIPASVTAAANNLGVIIPTAKGRKVTYGIYVLASFLVTNTVVAYATLEVPAPDWLRIALAVIGNSAVAFGGLAIANADNGSNK